MCRKPPRNIHSKLRLENHVNYVRYFTFATLVRIHTGQWWGPQTSTSVFAKCRRNWPPPLTCVDPHTTKRGVSVCPHFLASISRCQLLSQDRELLFIFCFGIGSVAFYFLRLRIIDVGYKKGNKGRQAFRPYMGALFSATN